MKPLILAFTLGFTLQATAAIAADSCAALPSHAELQDALKSNVKTTGNEINGGFELNMWGTVVSRDGTVCAVAMTGDDKGDQWPGSRVISAQKANTANAFSLPGLALSTANLWKATQPGGSLYGLQHSNPVDTDVAYGGDSSAWGSAKDPMVTHKIGGVNVFGGGLALYNSEGEIIGGLGVSGDSSCADHNVAWKTRDTLKLDYIPGGVSAAGDDNIIYDPSHAFSHVECGNSEVPIAEQLTKKFPAKK